MLKEAEIRIEAGRDRGKVFVIREMPAYDLEWFAIRAFQALGSSGINVPQEIADMGAVGFCLVAFQAFMGSTAEQIKPLRDEMMKCVFLRSSADAMIPFDPQLVFEIDTIRKIREAWLKLHTGFTVAELALYMNAQVSAMTMKSNSSATETSREPSESS
jgi:hypothetical protein